MRKCTGRVAPPVDVEDGKQTAVMSVRKFQVADADAVMAIATEAPEAAIWSRASYVGFADDRVALALVVETHEAISGFLIGRRVADQAEVLNLAVATNHRRKGQGTALLEAALDEFGLRGAKTVYLEVRESNTGAVAFYEKHGFAKTGRRKDYYRSPDEAAVTMERKLTGPTG
jgi:[ribosomal protein S18]-alanine N-acetyltransferase